MSEGVEILISADDQASKVLGNVADNVDAKVKRIREVGGRAKASTEFIGSLAKSLGGSELANYAGGLGQLTEKISAFSEVSKAGGAGALAFKAGLAGVAAVAGFQIGTMLGDWYFETARWTKQLAEATELLKKSGEEIARIDAVRMSFRVEKAELGGEIESRKLLKQLTEEAFAIEKQIEGTKKQQVKETEGLVGWARYLRGTSGQLAESSQAEVDVAEKRLAVIQKEREALAAKLSPYQEELKALREANSLKEKNQSYLTGLQQEVELLRATGRERASIEARQRTGGDEFSAKRAEALLLEKEAILVKQEAQKKADAEAKKASDDQVRNAERIAELKRNELAKLEEQRILLTQGKEAAAAFALEQQGLDRATAVRIASEKVRLDRLAALATNTPDAQQAVQGRLLTRGPSDNIPKQSLDVLKKMENLLGEIKGKLPLSTSSSLKLEVVGS
jgi:hypothetical protein